jgi:RNA polymerase sigma-70 factor (ECF subfamily)
VNSYKKSSQPLLDHELVTRVQRGDKAAFDFLVIKYQHKIIQLVSRYVKDRSEAQDLAQETFIKAYRAIGSFRGEAAFYTWLYRIAINTAKNDLTARSRRPIDYQVNMVDTESSDSVDLLQDNTTPETELLNQEILTTIKKAIEHLPEEMRIAIMLCEFDGLSYEDIAITMNCPVGTVRSRIFRAREAIDQVLSPLLSHGDFR